ncbi:MAG TPA: hypothetical protein VNC50_15500 [Planctomycetia bacterium]|nr:hypothetical protein [Planctomycetia bacterium]
MPSRRVCWAILACWAVTMAWAFGREILPRWRAAELMYSEVRGERAIDEPANWIILVDGRRAGRVSTYFHPQPGGGFQLTGKASLAGSLLAPQLGEAQLHLDSTAEIGPFGRLTSFKLGLSLEQNLRATLTGKTEGDRLRVTLDAPIALPFAQKEFELRLDPSIPIGSDWIPNDRLPNLRVGRTWTTRVFDPRALVGIGGGEARQVIHEVTGREIIEWDGRPWPCYVIEDRADEATGKTWARVDDGRILRQEGKLGRTTVTLELEPTKETPAP